MPVTNRGKFRIARALARNDAWPASFYVALVVDTPTPATNVFSELTEIATGNGYTGPVQVTRNALGFPSVVEDDSDALAYAQFEDLSWTALGGPIPSSGLPIAGVVFTDDNATPGDREIWGYSAVNVPSLASGEQLTIDDWRLILLEGIMSGVNNAANVGAGGVGIFLIKNGDVLQFKNINAASSLVSIADDPTNKEVDIDVNAANLALDASQIISGELALAQGGTGVDLSALAEGDLLVSDGTPELVFLPAGSEGEGLQIIGGVPAYGALSTAALATGTYTGDGNATQAVTGVGFQADSIIIYPQVDNIGPNTPGFKTDQDSTKTRYGTVYKDDHIISLDADGFTVGDGTGDSNGNFFNTAARVYTWIAWKV